MEVGEIGKSFDAVLQKPSNFSLSLLLSFSSLWGFENPAFSRRVGL
jgi:hypothetical protein